jgi:hypothetical protein
MIGNDAAYRCACLALTPAVVSPVVRLIAMDTNSFPCSGGRPLRSNARSVGAGAALEGERGRLIARAQLAEKIDGELRVACRAEAAARREIGAIARVLLRRRAYQRRPRTRRHRAPTRRRGELGPRGPRRVRRQCVTRSATARRRAPVAARAFAGPRNATSAGRANRCACSGPHGGDKKRHSLPTSVRSLRCRSPLHRSRIGRGALSRCARYVRSSRRAALVGARTSPAPRHRVLGSDPAAPRSESSRATAGAARFRRAARDATCRTTISTSDRAGAAPSARTA